MLPEFDVTVVTIRSGSRTVRVDADDATAARNLVQSECDDNQCHCPPEWCAEDVQSNVVSASQVLVKGVDPTAANAVTNAGFGITAALLDSPSSPSAVSARAEIAGHDRT